MLEIRAFARRSLNRIFALRRFAASQQTLRFAGRKVLLKRNTLGEAVNRRNEKKAFSEAASFFPFRLLLRGLKGASSPFLVGPARRNRWWFSGSLLPAKENLAPMQKQSYPAPPAREAVYKSTTLPTSAGVAGTGPRRTASASRRTTNSTGCPAAKAGR